MSLYFKAWQSAIASRDGIKKWFPRLVKKRKSRTILDISRKVTKRCTVTVGDALNVLHAAMEIIGEEMLEGYTVNLEGLGSFCITARSSGKGVDTFEEVNASQITGLHVRFLPAATKNPMYGVTRSMFSDVAFERIDVKTDGESGNTGDGDDDGGFTPDPNA